MRKNEKGSEERLDATQAIVARGTGTPIYRVLALGLASSNNAGFLSPDHSWKDVEAGAFATIATRRLG